jgi:hypothetical protein
MNSLILLLICLLGLSQGNFLRELFYNEESQATGLTIDAEVAAASAYNHASGGGSYSGCASSVDGYNYACGEIVSFVILVSTDSTYTTSTSSVFTLDFTPNPALKVKAVVNNCLASTTDSQSTCVNGASVSVMLSSTGDIQWTKLTASSRLVIRVDCILQCNAPISGSALVLNWYKVGSGNNVPLGNSIDFVNPTDVFNCDDENACTSDVIGGCMTARTCS